VDTTFHLSPDGNDQADGSAAHPWATLAGARDALRELRTSGRLPGPATVRLAAGRYPLSEPVDFGPEDGNITYRGPEEGEAAIDGGVELTGFREEALNGRRAWILDLPEVAAGRWHFRSLFVAGVRRPRARLPKFSPDAAGVDNVFRIGELRFPERRKLFDGDHVFKPKPGDVQDWPSLPDAEVVVLHYWIETRMGTPHVDPRTGWLTCARRSVFNLYESFNPTLARYYLDNLKEALSEPGEWYLDRADGRLTYLPVDGETLGQTRIVAPRIKAFVRIAGTAFNRGAMPADPHGGTPVANLRFERLAFRHADWFPPVADFLTHDRQRAEEAPIGSSPQGAVHVPGAIELRWARDCLLDRCLVEHVGLTAVAIEMGCRGCAVTRSTLRDLGGGGVRVGGAELDGPAADRTGHITVADNRITDLGKVFQQGIGVLLTHAFNCRVLHNEIARTCYTGISCGWSWGYRETISRDNLIADNHIHDIGQGVLSDMGGIYLLGVQPGTVVRGNHIHGVTSADYGGWGIYPDEGSSHLLIAGNWVHDIQGSPLRIHYARELAVRDNVFARSAQEGLVGLGKAEGHVAATLVGNVLLGPATCVFEGAYAGDVSLSLRSDANLVWFPDGAMPAGCAYPEYRKDAKPLSWDEWLAAGNDRRTVVADPKAIETDTDIVFPADSPVHQTGFQPRSWVTCGPRDDD
jgi:hypothetical protein